MANLDCSETLHSPKTGANGRDASNIFIFSELRSQSESRGGGMSLAIAEQRRECTVNETRKERRGFASMSPEKQREIASKGGRAAHQKGTAHEWSSDEAREAGRKGGMASRGGRGKLPAIGGTNVADELESSTPEPAA
jgi:general stress protein YciG